MAKREIVHYPEIIMNRRWKKFACGVLCGKFTRYKPDVTCKRCRRTRAFRNG